MGGAAPEPTSKGGKKALDANINLVPYIDMLMTIMTFLMMTAVWTQIAMLEVQNASGGPADETPPPTDGPKPIQVLLTDRGVKIQEEQNPDMKEFNVSGEGYDWAGITVELQRLKAARPDRHEVKIQSEDSVKYLNIAKMIDISTGLDLKAMTLTPTAQ